MMIRKDVFKKAFANKTLFNRFSFIVLLAICAWFYISLNKTGVVWWSDAARNALNGAFILDFIRAFPLSHPVDYAYDYYRQWPALTILFYPPLFYTAIAAVYAVFGVSESSALLTACLFLFALGWGAFRLSRRWLDPRGALAAAILTIGVPEMEFWGQQAMLDVPFYTLLMWAAVYLFRYIDTGRTSALGWCVTFFVLSVYTKYNSVFFAIALGVAILSAQGWRACINRKIWWAIAGGVILIAPLLAIFFTFARFNLDQAASLPTMTMPRWSIANWTFYASSIPASVTWPVFGLGLVYIVCAAFIPRFRLNRIDASFLIAWVLSGYVFYSLIADKEQRFDLFLVYPICVAAILFIDRTLRHVSWRCVVSLCLAIAVLITGQIIRPAPYVTGMREAADIAAKLAPPDSNIALWARWDGSFIYDMRAYEQRPDVAILRLDKVLLSDLAVTFEYGMKDDGLTADQIVDALRTYHVQYVVFQTGFHDDISSIHKLADLLNSDKFERVATVKITSNYPFSNLTELQVYRFGEDLPRGRVLPPIQIKLLGETLH